MFITNVLEPKVTLAPFFVYYEQNVYEHSFEYLLLDTHTSLGCIPMSGGDGSLFRSID